MAEPARNPPLQTSPYRLLVEGPDDKWVIVHLLARHGYSWDDAAVLRPFVQDVGGVEKLSDRLVKAVLDKRRLGIVVDADEAAEKRWAQLRGLLGRLGLAPPPHPDPDGVIMEGQAPQSQVGIWLMPDNRESGTLERFVATLVPADDVCWDFAGESAQRAQARYLGQAAQQQRACKDKDLSKSHLHTWLAWQKEPGLAMGTALTAAALDHESEAAQKFRDWFMRLFPRESAL